MKKRKSVSAAAKRKSVSATNILYTPRTDGEVIEGLATASVLPPELKEKYRVYEEPPLEVVFKIKEIIARLIKHSPEHFRGIDVSHFKVYLSADKTQNACMISHSKVPFIVIHQGLFEAIQHEDVLAGVIAHELGHYISYKETGLNDSKIGKIEEMKADAYGITLLCNASYNAHGLITFFNEHSLSRNHHLGQKNDNDIGYIINIVRDPHPTAQNRIRAMQNQIVAHENNTGITFGKDRFTQLHPALNEALNRCVYKSPLSRFLEEKAFKKMHASQKFVFLKERIHQILGANSTVSQSRAEELSDSLLAMGPIDLKDYETLEAFKSLVDLFYSYSAKLSYGHQVYISLETLWEQNGKDARYFARNEDLNAMLIQFINSKNIDEAKIYAKESLDILSKFSRSYVRNYLPNFSLPSIWYIRMMISIFGSYSPQHIRFVNWCKEAGTDDIKNLLSCMRVHDIDPYVQQVFKISKDGFPDGVHIRHDPKYIPAPHWYAFLKGMLRNENGDLVGIKPATKDERIYAFKWRAPREGASSETVKKHNQEQVQQLQAYEQSYIHKVDWSLAETDFSKFIEKYHFMLLSESSSVPLLSPFQRRLFGCLRRGILQNQENEQYLKDVKIYFEFHGSDFSKNSIHFIETAPCLEKHEMNRESNLTVWHPSDPFIEFLNDPISSRVIDGHLKLSYLMCCDAWFVNSDPNKDIESSVKTPVKIFYDNYPESIESTSDFRTIFSTNRFHSIVKGIEAQKLAQRLDHDNKLSLEDYKYLENECQYIERYDCNIKAFHKALLENVLVRAVNENDCSKLIANIKFAEMNKYLNLHPKLRLKAYEVFKNLLSNVEHDQKIEWLSCLIKPDAERYTAYRRHTVYNGYIPDPTFRKWLIDSLCDEIAKKHGLDDNSDNYYDEIKNQIHVLCENTRGSAKLEILSGLATKLNTQKRLSNYIQSQYDKAVSMEIKAYAIESVALELLLSQSNHDPVLRSLLIDFLSNAVSEQSVQSLRGYYIAIQNIDQIDDELVKIHTNFQSASLKVKMIVLDPLLFPVNSDESEQRNIGNNLIDSLFPRVCSNIWGYEKSQNYYAHLIVTSYLNVLDFNERRLMMTALFVANIKEENKQTKSVGQKLYTVLANMGPAGAKLLQAIHSHPETPDDIREDLVGAKTNFDMPHRWEIVNQIIEAGLLNEDDDGNPNSVNHIGPIKGAGSFGVTVFNTLADGSVAADTFLRKNAEDRAQRQFGFMQKAAIGVIASETKLRPIMQMIQEARQSTTHEVSMEFARQANLIAESSYHGVKVRCKDEAFTHKVTRLVQHGEQYKRVEIAQGEHFNDLPDSPRKVALAKAMLATQISLRLAGIHTDLDRHGGNIKVAGNDINHFDFGAMYVDPITIEDKKALGKALAQTVLASRNTASIFAAFSNTIENANVSEHTRCYLNSLMKDLLAMGDYVNVLSGDDIKSIFAKCLMGMGDPEIKAAFNEYLGVFKAMCWQQIEAFAKKSDVEIHLGSSHHQREDLHADQPLQLDVGAPRNQAQPKDYLPTNHHKRTVEAMRREQDNPGGAHEYAGQDGPKRKKRRK